MKRKKMKNRQKIYHLNGIKKLNLEEKLNKYSKNPKKGIRKKSSDRGIIKNLILIHFK